MRDTYKVSLRVFTAAYSGEGQDSPCWGEEDLRLALADLLSTDREKVTKALKWVRQNVRGFIQQP